MNVNSDDLNKSSNVSICINVFFGRKYRLFIEECKAGM